MVTLHSIYIWPGLYVYLFSDFDLQYNNIVLIEPSLFPGTSGGGGSFSYVDSTGNRYGGSYGVKDGKVVSATGDINPEHFADTAFNGDNIGPNFGPEYLSNLENILQE